jgi:excinuclease ABC subunit B
VDLEADEALAVAEGTDDRDIARVLADMETEMLAAADELQFERAANLRDQIEALRTGKPASPKRHKGRR